MEEFELGKHEYIELCNLLKIMGFCESGGFAKNVIAQGEVTVDGEVETRKTCKIKTGKVVEYNAQKVKVV
ncbi:MAG: ribosome-associated protein [Bacteriovoracaceae bacterium]|jgi:ribosome-associated protein